MNSLSKLQFGKSNNEGGNPTLQHRKDFIMKKDFIAKFAPIAIVAITLTLMFTIFASAASPFNSKAEEIIHNKLVEIGVEDGTVGGFYVFAINKIASCFEDMDSAMETATGREHNLADEFHKAIDEMLDEFSNITSDEEAIDKLDEIIGDIEQ